MGQVTILACNYPATYCLARFVSVSDAEFLLFKQSFLSELPFASCGRASPESCVPNSAASSLSLPVKPIPSSFCVAPKDTDL
ncbi:hypothetical protein Hanom_Chr03g00215301 [Helianthus anomalus]